MSSVIHTTNHLVTPRAVPPMDVIYAFRHIKGLGNADDVLIANWIEAAEQEFEEQTGRQVMLATWEYWLDAFPDFSGRIELPKPPLQSVVSVQYVADDGTLTSYDDAASPPTVLWESRAPAGPYAARGWVVPTFGNSWPVIQRQPGAVRIQYTCGYASIPEQVPPLITGILCYLVANHDRYRPGYVEQSRGNLIELPWVQRQINAFKYAGLESSAPRSVVA
jgi:uncharacterized phiE125 gp8 family phage protein